MLRIVCPFCGQTEERKFADGRVIHHSIVCSECRILEHGRVTISEIITAISVLFGSENREGLSHDNKTHTLMVLQKDLSKAIAQLDIYLNEEPPY